MRLFIIRPFGIKEGIDFERVDAELIQPAIKRLSAYGFTITGGTTGEISRQGNIREDMFRSIVTADLVIADVSIHNANVFYELGIRHALRPRRSFLIRSHTDHDYPFDLQTDRYFLYDASNPGVRVEEMVVALRSTIASTERDSPIFMLLPKLLPHVRGQLIKAPYDFQESVALALTCKRRGDLRLLAHEVTSFDWDQEGLRQIGEAQLKLRAFKGAKETFESLLKTNPEDVQANLKLGTIYQRLALKASPESKEELLLRSDQAIQRVLANGPSTQDRAEALCLLGSNEKSRWIDDFSGITLLARQEAALRSPHLKLMLDHYLQASNLDLNAYYPSINTLAILKMQIALAGLLTAVWQEDFDDADNAGTSLKARDTLASRITSTLSLALKMDHIMTPHGGEIDPWALSSRADLLLLTSYQHAKKVENGYRTALNGVDRFTLEATRRNISIYKDLGLFEPGVSAALQVIDNAIEISDKSDRAPTRVILFTGHMLDAPDRTIDKMRFPPTVQAEAKARAMIFDAVKEELRGHEGKTIGIAGGACGSDILFHEVCHELGVATELCLALPEDKFQVTSVQRGGANWIERYRKLTSDQVPLVLQQNEALPNWLADYPNYDLWQRNNLWMMYNALAKDARHLTLIALFNREREPDGTGGTAHMLVAAEEWGFKTIKLNAQILLSS